jgi:hypothetical protein
MGGYHHALRDRSSTGSDEFVFTFDLHDTHSAGGRGFFELGQVAKGGNLDGSPAGCLQDGGSFLDSYFSAING